jgi:ParB-like chromosome segregation protein Spo0J
MKIRDRIKELRRVRASELKPHKNNWRKHPKQQQDALRGLLAEVGYADALLARELPDGSLELCDGHLRAETTPDQEVPVLVLDLNDAEAAKVLATLDPLAAMAEADPVKLDAVLREFCTTNEAIEQVLSKLAEDAGIIPPDFQPTDAESQGRLDVKDPIVCPNCGHEFTT